jgi:uncharacterized cysteine cluster protein YcgN (CxxCxxCC family)
MDYDRLTMVQKEPFWKVKMLEEMTHEEWESLCDGCAKCCLHKIEDMNNGQVYTTDVSCRLLDLSTCRCKDYAHRAALVKDCIALTPAMVKEIKWLPRSCAYRRLEEGRGLAWWHPLVSGDQHTVLLAGISVCGKIVPEESINMAELEERIVDWFD